MRNYILDGSYYNLISSSIIFFMLLIILSNYDQPGAKKKTICKQITLEFSKLFRTLIYETLGNIFCVIISVYLKLPNRSPIPFQSHFTLIKNNIWQIHTIWAKWNFINHFCLAGGFRVQMAVFPTVKLEWCQWNKTS